MVVVSVVIELGEKDERVVSNQRMVRLRAKWV